MVIALESVVKACIAPLVRATVSKHVGEVVVIIQNTILPSVEVLPILLTIHEDFHGLTTMLKPDDCQHRGHRDPNADQDGSRSAVLVHEALEELPWCACVEAVLCIEVLDRVDGGVVDATHNPRRTVQRANDWVVQAHDGVGSPHESVGSHFLLALQREVRANWLDRSRAETTTEWGRHQRAHGPSQEAAHPLRLELGNAVRLQQRWPRRA
mmetsp:Transcript_48678/g.115676  ORF Transcript_48678/g.115676 Transcript_48678/m.115676 type:complete len:211 (-) Transcript_48678:66-698(-)